VGAYLALTGSHEFADAVERALFEHGAVGFRCESADIDFQQKIVYSGGIAISLVFGEESSAEVHAAGYDTVSITNGPDSASDAAEALIEALTRSGIIHFHSGVSR
jgi:hypothetical protein